MTNRELLMLVDRRIFNIARTKMDGALTILTELRSSINWKHPVRIYAPSIAKFDQIIVETEFTDWAEMEEFWRSWETTPEAEAFFAKWEEVALPGGQRELWEVVE